MSAAALEISLETADAIGTLVERLRKQSQETAQELDRERARSRRLYAETVEQGKQILRLEAEKRRLVEQLDEALLPRSMG